MNSIRKIPYVPFASKKGHNFIKFGSECIKSLASALKTSQSSSCTFLIKRLTNGCLAFNRVNFLWRNDA